MTQFSFIRYLEELATFCDVVVAVDDAGTS